MQACTVLHMASGRQDVCETLVGAILVDSLRGMASFGLALRGMGVVRTSWLVSLDRLWRFVRDGCSVRVCWRSAAHPARACLVAKAPPI